MVGCYESRPEIERQRVLYKLHFKTVKVIVSARQAEVKSKYKKRSKDPDRKEAIQNSKESIKVMEKNAELNGLKRNDQE